MSKSSLKIVLLCDFPGPVPAKLTWRRLLSKPDWRDERDVMKSLVRLGHQPEIVVVYNDASLLVEQLEAIRPDLIFNMSESFDDDRDLEPDLISLVDLLGIPCTGASASALRLCKDKGMTKKILHWDGISVPKFAVQLRGQRRPREFSELACPRVVKPLGLEASEGISQLSVVTTERATSQRIDFIHHKLGVDAIVEEYVSGRELYVGCLGNQKLSVFRPQEMYLGQLPETMRLATHMAKWNRAYRRRWGIVNRQAKLSDRCQQRLNDWVKDVYRRLGLCGYARIDLRMTADEEFVFLEANPNPAICQREDFAESARHSGWAYDDLVQKIIKLALSRDRMRVKSRSLRRGDWSLPRTA